MAILICTLITLRIRILAVVVFGYEIYGTHLTFTPNSDTMLPFTLSISSALFPQPYLPPTGLKIDKSS